MPYFPEMFQTLWDSEKELAGMTLWEFQNFLASKKNPD